MFSQIAIAEEIACQGSLGAITVDNVKVPQGKTCTLNRTTVKGNIVVERRATLKAIGAKLDICEKNWVATSSKPFVEQGIA